MDLKISNILQDIMSPEKTSQIHQNQELLKKISIQKGYCVSLEVLKYKFMIQMIKPCLRLFQGQKPL